MSDVSRDRSGPSRGRWVLVCALLTPAVVLPLVVPIYDRDDPTFLDFPFYYWFQFALIVLAVALTVPAFFLAKGAERADRVRHGLTPEPPEEPAERTQRTHRTERTERTERPEGGPR